MKALWGYDIFGFTVGQLITALLILVGFLIARKFFAHSILNRLKIYAQKEHSRIDPKILYALDKPIQLLPLALGFFFAFTVLTPTGNLKLFASNLVQSIVVMALFWGLYNVVEPLSNLSQQLKRKFTDALIDFFVKLIKVLLVFVAIATILEIWGIKVAPILAGLGLFGVAIALGAQDLFKNLIGGLLIVGEKRFNKGDEILVDGLVEGYVEQLGFRSTLIRRSDKAPVYVPNAKLSDSAVVNLSAKTHRRIFWHIGLDYKTSFDQLMHIRNAIEDYILTNVEFAKPPAVPTYVRVDKLAESSIDIIISCFTESTALIEWLNAKERLAFKIKEIVEGVGANFASPAQTLYVQNIAANKSEILLEE